MTGFDISDTLAPKSDQLDAVDLVSGPRTFLIERVSKGNAEQPVQIHFAEFPRPWRPGLSMRRVLVACWGKDASAYVGRSVRLYCDPDVRFGGMAVGGTRVEALSHMDKPKQVPLLIARGKSAIFVVKPLADAPKPAPVPDYAAEAEACTDAGCLRGVWNKAKEAGHLTDDLKGKLTAIGKRIAEQPAEDYVEEPPATWQPADDQQAIQ